jgi:hypothetical protein
MSDQTKMAGCTTLKKASRYTTVLLSLTAWFFVSNHCAVGVISSSAEASAEAGGCPMHVAAPAKEKPAAKIPCCKEIRALVAKSVTTVLTLAARFPAGQEYARSTFPPPPRHTIELFSLDTGPPGSLSFAELILQESMPAHAPPVS